jgi:hypothetical protein
VSTILPGEVVKICRDETCPTCGWPETFVETTFDPVAILAVGCRKCGWRCTEPTCHRAGLPSNCVDCDPETAVCSDHGELLVEGCSGCGD